VARTYPSTRSRRFVCDPTLRPAGCFILMQRTAACLALPLTAPVCFIFYPAANALGAPKRYTRALPNSP
jgi:hypothetical protein